MKVGPVTHALPCLGTAGSVERRRPPSSKRGQLPGLIVLGAVLSLAASSGCSDSRAASGVVERIDSAGLEIVVLDGADRALEWRFERDFTLGGAEEGPESFYSVGATTVDVDGEGNLHVLDASAHRVVVFDAEGRFVREFGGEGAGPGEMRFPASLNLEADGTVAVFDFGKRGLVRFSPEGTPIEERELRLPPLPFRQRFWSALDDGFAAATMDLDDATAGGRAHLLRVRGADTTELTGVRLPEAEMVRFPECGGGLRLPPLFHPEIVWDARDGVIVASAASVYRLDVFRGDSLVRSLRRRLEPRPATRALALEELGEGMEVNFGRGPCRLDPGRMVDGRGFAEVVSPVAWIDIAPDGTLWVRRKVVGEEDGPIDLLDPEGGYLGTLPAGSPRPVAFLPDGRVAAVETDEFDVDRLVVHRIVKEPPE